MKHEGSDRDRSLFAIGASVVITFLLIILNLSIHFFDTIRDFFASFEGIPFVSGLLNLLSLWLVILMWISLRNWRRVHNRNLDLEAIISSISPDALLVIDPDRTIRVCNHSVERIFGVKPDAAIGQKTDVLYYDRRNNTNQKGEIYEALRRDGFHYGLAAGKRTDGTTVPLEIITGELVGRSGAVLLIRDIRERLAIEEQRRRLEERALQSQKLESLGLLAGGVAHDFNNLLMIIQGHAELVRSSDVPGAAVHESMLEIHKSTSRARDLCRHLLSFAGRAPRDLGPVDLSQVVNEAGNLLKVSVPRHIRLALELPADLPTFEGDDSQLSQVVMNLITNALEAMGEREGCITVATGVQADVKSAIGDPATDASDERDGHSGPFAYLRVMDTGCGMDEETRRRIWEPFYTTKKHGHGMGMAAVLGIIRSHGGLINVESKFGEGSTITVFFPVQPSDA
ncbi:MAG: ATP-binding protein [Verrucomicrobia bacterium]|nr:ATP-binding protein [Verrucomicrobiota bacterium]